MNVTVTAMLYRFDGRPHGTVDDPCKTSGCQVSFRGEGFSMSVPLRDYLPAALENRIREALKTGERKETRMYGVHGVLGTATMDMSEDDIKAIHQASSDYQDRLDEWGE